MKVAREREIKLDIDHDARLGDVSEAVAGLRAVDDGRKTLRAVYYDTADLRLARWGWTIRQRNDEGWVVKMAHPPTGRTLVRDEVHFGGSTEVGAGAAEPPPEAVGLVSAFTRGVLLRPVATLTNDRGTTRFITPEAETLIELVDDRVTAECGDGSEAQFREVEVELAGDVGDDAVEQLLGRLEALGCRASEGTSKLVRALGARALEPPDVVVPSVSEWATGREVVHAAVASSVEHLLRHLPIARLGDDPEGIHQARVAIRRLRSDLRTFKALIDATWARRLQPELQWLGQMLGHVRDDDVLIDTLQRMGADHALIEVIEDERAMHRADLLAALDSPRALRLLDDLVAAAHDPVTTPQADDPAADTLAMTLRKRWRTLRRAADALDVTPPDAELHDLRIQVKRCRYAIEAGAVVFGGPAKRAAKRLARLQDVLGELNDATVITARLHDVARRAPSVGFAAGYIAGQLTIRADTGRKQWHQSWTKASAKEAWRWL